MNDEKNNESGDPFAQDSVDFGDDFGKDDFEEFESGQNSLGDVWRNNPLVKIGVIAGGLITVIGAILLFGGGDPNPERSFMQGGNEVTSAPGTGEVSDTYRQAVEETNVQRTEEAVRTGESVIPTPVDTSVSRLNVAEDPSDEEDPLERWRRIQEERNRRVQVAREPVQEQDPNLDAVSQLAEAMSQQMEEILRSADQPIPMRQVVVADSDFIEQEREREQEKIEAEQEAIAAANPAVEDPEVVDILIAAGSLEYGQLITEANSDAEAPILAQLVSGPLAGSRLIGSFEVEEDFLVLSFNTIVVDGVAQPANILALNPDTTSPGLATEVDKRYFRRVFLPAAAAFIEGVGEAIADSGSTNVSVSGDTVTESEEDLDTREELFKGVNEAAGKIGEILDEDASAVEPLIRVESGTPLGLMFLQPVIEASNEVASAGQ